MKALRLFLLTKKRRKGDIPVISFDDLGVPFQDSDILDLRNKGLCSLGTDQYGRCGVSISPECDRMDTNEFIKLINKDQN